MRYYTVKEAAEILGVTEKRVYDLIREGSLPADPLQVEVKRLSIKKNDLSRYIKNKRPVGRPRKKED